MKYIVILLLSGVAVSCTYRGSILGTDVSPERSPGDKVGIMVMAHGGSDKWNEAVREAVHPLSSQWPVEIAFGMADPHSLQSAVAELERQQADRIVVVRLFLSGSSFLHQTEYLLRLRPDAPQIFLTHGVAQENISSDNHTVMKNHDPPSPVQTRLPIFITRDGILDSPVCGKILAERAESLSKAPEEESVLILAHGAGDDSDNDQWLAKMDHIREEIAGTGPFNRVKVETLREDWPDKRGPAEERIRNFIAEERRQGRRVIVIPLRLYGFGPYSEVLHDLTYVSDGRGLLPHHLVTEWLRNQVVKAEGADG